MCFRRRHGDGNHFPFDLRYKLIATAHHRRDKALVLRSLPQCFAQSRNMHLEVAFLHHSLRPRASHELFLGDEFAPALDERRQQVQGASANRYARTAIEQCLLRRDEPKKSKPVRSARLQHRPRSEQRGSSSFTIAPLPLRFVRSL